MIKYIVKITGEKLKAQEAMIRMAHDHQKKYTSIGYSKVQDLPAGLQAQIPDVDKYSSNYAAYVEIPLEHPEIPFVTDVEVIMAEGVEMRCVQ